MGGARLRRSTTSDVEALIKRLQEGMQVSKCFALGLFDLEDAYNTVYIPTLASKLSAYLSDAMVR